MLAGWKNETTQHITRRMNTMHEYQLLARPDLLTNEWLNSNVRQLMPEGDCQGPYEANINIPVAGFYAREQMEETLIRWIQRICAAQKSFVVAVEDHFNVMENTMSVKIKDNTALLQIIRQLKVIEDFIASSSCPPPQFAGIHYLEIAVKLPAVIFKNLVPGLCKKIFQQSFAMHELLLLKQAHVSGSFTTIHVFPFLPQDVLAGSKIA